MATKEYDIYCVSKANRSTYVHRITVAAGSVKEAKEEASRLLRERLGRHAFNLTNGKLPTNWDWDRITQILGVTKEEIMREASDPHGYAF